MSERRSTGAIGIIDMAKFYDRLDVAKTSNWLRGEGLPDAVSNCFLRKARGSLAGTKVAGTAVVLESMTTLHQHGK
eukprot:8291025-Karenia_brevis.AAC.1